jgi:hypothetical protein
MNERNVEWVLDCINSCTNNDQLNCCEVLIGLYKFRLTKDGTSDLELYNNESLLLEAYINKRALLEII